MTVLRPGLLRGIAIALAGGVAAAIRDALEEGGATTEELEDGLDEDQAREWAHARASLHALVFDSRRPFADGGADGLRLALEQAWTSTRALANGAFIPAGAGKILLVGPSAGAGDHVEAARSGLENLARTLSVEWARYGVTATATMPGERTADAELAELIGFLASPAGSYFSGCRLDLGTTPPAHPR